MFWFEIPVNETFEFAGTKPPLALLIQSPLIFITGFDEHVNKEYKFKLASLFIFSVPPD